MQATLPVCNYWIAKEYCLPGHTVDFIKKKVSVSKKKKKNSRPLKNMEQTHVTLI